MINYINIISLLALFSGSCYSQENDALFLKTSILSRVLYIKSGSGSGSSFVVEKNDKSYIISARHLFTNNFDNQCIEFSIMQNNKWVKLQGTVHLNKNSSVDAIVIELDYNIFGNKEVNYLNHFGNVPLGSEGYFLGYPLGFKTEINGGVNYGLPIPLVKKFVYSGTIVENGGKVHLLDGNNTLGFSGGPAFVKCYINEKQNWQLFGIVVGYYNQLNKLKDNDRDYQSNENSGIIKCIAIEDIKEIIDGL